MEKWSRIFYFEVPVIPLAHSEILAYLPDRFRLSGQIFLDAATQKGLVEFQKKNLDHSLSSFLSQKCWFQDLRDFSLLILGVLGGVPTDRKRQVSFCLMLVLIPRLGKFAITTSFHEVHTYCAPFTVRFSSISCSLVIFRLL